MMSSNSLGVCTPGQVKSVFTILDIYKCMTPKEFDDIIEQFKIEETKAGQPLFCYRDFVAEVDQDFTTPGLEKDPLVTVTMPNAATTSPGRVNRIAVRSEAQLAQIDELHEKLVAEIQARRILLLPVFRDMDKTR